MEISLILMSPMSGESLEIKFKKFSPICADEFDKGFSSLNHSFFSIKNRTQPFGETKITFIIKTVGKRGRGGSGVEEKCKNIFRRVFLSSSCCFRKAEEIS